jgi:hypothetical protein
MDNIQNYDSYTNMNFIFLHRFVRNSFLLYLSIGCRDYVVFLFILVIKLRSPITVAARSGTRTVFAHSILWFWVRSLCVYSVFVLSLCTWRSCNCLIRGPGVRSSPCGLQTVDQFVLVSCLPLGPLTRFSCSFFV